MARIDEARDGQNTPLNAALDAGIDQLSYEQEITFTQYVRVVLPLDGFVFWVKADLLTESALYNAFRMNSVTMNDPGSVATPAKTLTVKGSFHFATDLTEEETETSSANRVVFTAEKAVNDLNAVGPGLMYIGEFPGARRFAFSQQGMFYRQADIYHYVGTAVGTTMEPQLVDDPNLLDTRLVVSNSLPIWLSMNRSPRQFYEDFGNVMFPLYPSFLAPQNQAPPFGTVHVAPEGTMALASAPFLSSSLGHSQLCRDLVRVTLYGVRNDAALDFMDFVNQFSVNTDLIGIMNVPVLADDKQPQAEFNTLAVRKSVTFEVSYYQRAARDAARQLIKEVFVHYFLGTQEVPH